MEYVFDYDPLVVEIERLASDGHYETQERLITRIVEACAQYSEIKAIETCLKKTPVRPSSGSLGVRLFINQDALTDMRNLNRIPID
jgi:dihydroneopterin aldolase